MSVIKTTAEGDAPRPNQRTCWLDSLTAGTAWYYCTSLIVVVAAVFSFDFVKMCGRHSLEHRLNVVDSLAAWDGNWYVGIVRDGYAYDPERSSNVAFYPVYPLLAGALSKATGMTAEWALVGVSHAMFCGACVLMHAYVRGRYPTADASLADYAVLAMGLVPTTLYFRMAYSESTLLCLAILAMLGMQRRWPLPAIAIIVGLATASRAVGVALLLPLALHLWERSATWKGFVARCFAWLPLSCWGLAGWMAYQSSEFGDCLAFVKTQAHWRHRLVEGGGWRTAWDLLTLEPMRAVYDADCPCYWGHLPPAGNHLFNARFWTPLAFLGTAGCVALGRWRRWLNLPETALSAGLLLIPYVTHAHANCMAGAQRYATVAFPVYLVLGQLLVRCPAPLAGVLMSLSGLMLGLFAALFVAWYWYY